MDDFGRPLNKVDVGKAKGDQSDFYECVLAFLFPDSIPYLKGTEGICKGRVLFFN